MIVKGTVFPEEVVPFLSKISVITMKKTILLTLLATVMALASCGPEFPKGSMQGGYIGKFTDEFGNKFELRDGNKATIQFSGVDSVIQTQWATDDVNDSCATIAFNMDPHYYYLKDGKLFRHHEDMKAGHPAINIEYEDED